MKTAAFTIPDLAVEQEDSGNRWFEFLNVQSLSMGIYRVPAKTTDRDTHTPHNRDEVYVVVEGKGLLTADSIEFVMEPKSVVFVKAGVEHYFHNVTDDLTLLVYFAAPEIPIE